MSAPRPVRHAEFTLRVVTANPQLSREDVEQQLRFAVARLAEALDPDARHRVWIRLERVSRWRVTEYDYDPDHFREVLDGEVAGTVIALDGARRNGRADGETAQGST